MTIKVLGSEFVSVFVSEKITVINVEKLYANYGKASVTITDSDLVPLIKALQEVALLKNLQ